MVIMMGSNFILTLTYMYLVLPAKTFFVLFETETNSKVVYLL